MESQIDLLRRIADALDRLAPPPAPSPSLDEADAFVWQPDRQQERDTLLPVLQVSRVALHLLRGIEHAQRILLDNTRQFAAGLPANNAMLWGARGMGKSSLVKAVHAAVNAERGRSLALIEIHREDIATLPRLMATLRRLPRRILVFCDDLSFERADADHKALKSVLDGGIEGRPDNVLFYATSNRRHLMPRDMIDNEEATAISPGEATEEKVSLSDRFGLWLGFHGCDQATYFSMVEGYAAEFGIAMEPARLRAEAAEWAVTRGSRSGRVAWQFVQGLAGQLRLVGEP